MVEQTVREDNFKIYIDNFFKDLKLYDDYKGKHDYKGLLKASIDVFLQYESDYTAKEVYRMFFMIYQITGEDKSKRQENEDVVGDQNILLDLIDVMGRYEKNTGELIDRQRDHFIHSVNVFLLGLAIYAQNSNYRSIFEEYIENSGYEKYYRHKDGRLSREEFLYRWGIASLLHDIGYPFEIVGKQLKKIINDGVKSISNSYDLKLGIDFDDFDEFNSIIKIPPYCFAEKFRRANVETRVLDLFKPTDILVYKIAQDFDFDFDKTKLLREDLNSFIRYMKENDFIDHGFYSAILVLDSYGKVLQKYEKDFDFFFYPVVDSASAILLHNYYNKTLQNKDKPFNLKQMDPSSSPISYLLILCDELQEWNRQPFGIIDKKKLYVNELSIEINDNKMEIEYILKDGYMGLGFSKDKKEFIEDVLDIDAIFDRGIGVFSDVNIDVEREIMRNIDIDEIESPDIFIRNIEKIAEKINLKYNEYIRKKYNLKKVNGEKIDKTLQNSYNYLEDDFSKLDSQFKLSNLRQARSIPKKLNLIGCEIASKSDPRPAMSSKEFDEQESNEFDEQESNIFSKHEIINLAIFEHQEWCEEKRGNGWTYGEVKNNQKRESPYLVRWEELSKETKDLDILTVTSIPSILEDIGLKVVRSKIRLLTYKMQDYYEKENPKSVKKNEELDENATSEDKFNKLDEYVKYANYKQANFIVKILNEKGYDLVDINDKGDPIEKFSNTDINHFAEREHYGWCRLKYDLGWRYGKTFNEKNKRSPNLVKWDKLDSDVKKNNKNTFKNLPKMCAEEDVGLKIIRSE